MWTDVQYALRSLARQPLFYAVVLLTLALGIGANAAIFTVVNAVLLRPLPYPDPDRLMMVWTYNPRQGFDKDVGTYPNFEDWRRGSQSFERMSAYFGASVTLTGSGDPAQIRGARVTHEFLETMQRASRPRPVVRSRKRPRRRRTRRPPRARPVDAPVRRRSGHRRSAHHAERGVARSARRDAGELRPPVRRGALAAAGAGRNVRRICSPPAGRTG